MAKNLPGNVGELGLIPEWGRSPGKGNGNPLQYSCLEKSLNRGAWWVTVHRVTKSNTTEWLTVILEFSSGLFILFHWSVYVFYASSVLFFFFFPPLPWLCSVV